MHNAVLAINMSWLNECPSSWMNSQFLFHESMVLIFNAVGKICFSFCRVSLISKHDTRQQRMCTRICYVNYSSPRCQQGLPSKAALRDLHPRRGTSNTGWGYLGIGCWNMAPRSRKQIPYNISFCSLKIQQIYHREITLAEVLGT